MVWAEVSEIYKLLWQDPLLNCSAMSLIALCLYFCMRGFVIDKRWSWIVTSTRLAATVAALGGNTRIRASHSYCDHMPRRNGGELLRFDSVLAGWSLSHSLEKMYGTIQMRRCCC